MSAYTNQSASPSSVIVVAVVLPVLCTATVLLRFYIRYALKVRLMTDDWLILPTLLLTIGMGASMIVGTARKAIGYPHTEPSNLSPSELLVETNPQSTLIGIIAWEFQFIQVLALGFVKLSVLYFYRRIFSIKVANQPFDIATRCMIWIIILWTVSFSFASFFSCGTHLDANWTTVENFIQYCVSLNFEIAFAVSDMICDLLILILPLPMIWQLHMPLKKKIAVTAVFLLGFITLAASVTRSAIFINAVNAGLDADLDLVNTEILYWSMLETGLALIAACLPSLNPLWTKMIDSRVMGSFISLVSTSTKGSHGSHSSSNTPRWQASDHNPLPSDYAPSTGSKNRIFRAESEREVHELRTTMRDNMERRMATSKGVQDGISLV